MGSNPTGGTNHFGIRPHSIGGWLAHLGIADKDFDALTVRSCRSSRSA